MPRLIRLYILQCLLGFALSGAFVGLLLWLNVANLWHLVRHAEAGLLAVFLLWMFNGLVFAGVQFAITIMRMQDDGTTPGRGTKVPAGMTPALALAQAPRRRRGRRI